MYKTRPLVWSAGIEQQVMTVAMAGRGRPLPDSQGSNLPEKLNRGLHTLRLEGLMAQGRRAFFAIL